MRKVATSTVDDIGHLSFILLAYKVPYPGGGGGPWSSSSCAPACDSENAN